MSKPDVSPPAGTRDFFAEDLELRERVLRTVRTVFERHGFSPLETPAFEKLDIITGKYGEEEKLIFKILKRGEKQSGSDSDLALRYDFTVPLARVVARYPDRIGKFFRRYQIGPVWRADRPGKGRFREFYQCDFDIVGSKSLNVEVEIFLLLADVLAEVGVRDFTIRINSREVLNALMEMSGVPPELQASAITAIDKLDKIGVSGVGRELAERGLPSESRDLLLRQVEAYAADPDNLRKQIDSSSKGQPALVAIDQVIAVVQPLMNQGKLQFDPFLARGLSYYTGIIFEVSAEGIASSIASGGRYDNLVGMFSPTDVPACGGSLGIERILMVLQSTGAMDAKRTSPDVLVTVWDESLQPTSFRFATHLRQLGINTEVYVGEGRIPEQIGYASKKNIPYSVVIGPDEASKNQVAVREMASRNQTLATWDEAAQIVRGPAKV